MAKTYKDYQKEIAELQKKAEDARRTERAGAITQIKSLMKEFNLTIKDLKLKKEKILKAPRKAVPAKYRDPVSGETWTGRGRSPAWAVKAKAENQLDKFLIFPAAKPPQDKIPGKAAPKKAAQKLPAVRKGAKPTAPRGIKKLATKTVEQTAPTDAPAQ